MNNQKNAIGVLCLTASLLLVVLFFVPKPATAEISVSGADYNVCTLPLADNQGGGSDGLYITDSRSGMIALFAYDFRRKSLEPLSIRPIADAFKQR